MNNVWPILLCWVGILIWGFGIMTSMVFLFDTMSGILSRIGSSILCLILFGIFGMTIACYGILTPVRDYHYSYVSPTSVIKTNDVVIINHVVNGRVLVSSVSYDISYWNATNIMIEIMSGKGFFMNNVDPRYNIVLH